ncbi:MAG: M28 family peptidase [Gemmatimonadota bacterium]
MDTLHRVTESLARDIGPRRAGSGADRRAADLLEATFGRVCPEVVRHEYRFLGWDPGDEGELTLGGETFDTRLGIACPPTPAGGVTGVLESLGRDVYGLRPPGAGGPAAHLMAYRGPGGQAIPLLWRPYGSIPAGILGAAMEERLAAAARYRETVTFTCNPALEPGAVSWNVEGVLPGDRQRQVVVVAHYDTVYGSPGANDNGASCAALFALAERLAASPRGNRPTLRFLATGAEEIDLIGARCYVRDLLWRGGSPPGGEGRIHLALNFDSLTWGDGLRLGAAPNAEAFLPALAAALGSARLTSYDGTWERVPLGEGVDSGVFAAAGLPTINANTAGDPVTVALWHTPGDTVDRVPWARAADGVEVFARFLEQLR